MYYLTDFQDFKLGSIISNNPERLLQRGEDGNPGFIGVFATKTWS